MDSESQSENRKKVKVKRTNDEGSAKARMRDKKRHRESEEVLDDPQIKKPRIERELAGDATTNGTSEMQENDNKRGKKRRRHQASLEELPEEERRRREEQRAAQAKAIEMRAAGKVYKRPKKRQATESAKQDMADPDAKMKNQAKYEDEEGSRPEIDVQVIVVPIFWNRKPAEKASVIRAANKIVAILQGQGLTSGMDTTNSLSPGQKFEFWENKGVKVRIEVGPRDASQESCVLAKSQKAGSVAQKSTYKVNPQLVSHVQKALGIESEPGTEVEMTETEKDKSSEAKILDNGKRKSLASGDDLQGDFNEIQLIDDQPKKKRPKSG